MAKRAVLMIDSGEVMMKKKKGRNRCCEGFLYPRQLRTRLLIELSQKCIILLQIRRLIFVEVIHIAFEIQASYRGLTVKPLFGKLKARWPRTKLTAGGKNTYCLPKLKPIRNFEYIC